MHCIQYDDFTTMWSTEKKHHLQTLSLTIEGNSKTRSSYTDKYV